MNDKKKLLLLAVVALGIFLRFFQIEERLVFHGEIGHNYLAIKNFIEAEQIPLLGPPTSHPWLSFGPLFYWIFTPILVLANYNPLSGGYFFGTVGALVILANFWVIKRVFDEGLAFISSFLIAVSPAFLNLTREARFFSLVVLLFYPFLYFLIKVLKEKGKGMFWLGITYSVMLNFHLTPIVFVPPLLILFWLYRKEIDPRQLKKGLIGILIPQIPFILHNMQTNFEMIGKLVAWIPYRILGFLGMLPTNNLSSGVFVNNIFSLFEFFGASFAPSHSVFYGLVFLLVLFLFTLLKARGRAYTRKLGLIWRVLILLFIFGCIGIFVHGSPPSHYYLPIYPLPILFASLLLIEVWRKKRALVLLFLLIVSYTNIKWYLAPIETDLVSYSDQLEISRKIVSDARGRPFALYRDGPNDHFEGDYAQNYQYLLWWLGNEPVESTTVEYTIHEDGEVYTTVKKL